MAELNLVPDLSIVIVAWKMKVMLQDLLHSLREHTSGISYQLIVIDNHSEDGTAAWVRKDFPESIVIENSFNRGVGRARNQGFFVARGRYIIHLDADMVILENSLQKIVQFMDETPDAGLCGAKLVSPEGVVQPSARRYPTALALFARRVSFIPAAKRSRALRQHEMAEWDHSDTRSVDYVIGACQCIRRSTMERVGLFDENIFYGPEDVDYCLRVQKEGWKVYYFPKTAIVHHEQRATKKKLISKLSFLHLKGLIYLFIKYRGRLSSV
jgi:hypothetical protein